MLASSRRRLTTVACLATLYVVWGSTYLAIRVAVMSFPPLQMAALRFLTAGSLLYALLRARGAPTPTRREWGSSVAIGLPLMGVGLGGASVAMTHVTSGVAAMVFGSAPVWTALFEHVQGVRLRLREAVGMTIALGGLALVATRGELRAEPGAAMILAVSASTYALGCSLARRLPQPKGSISAAAQMIAAGLALAVASALRGERFPAHVPWVAILSLTHLVVLGSMVAYAVFNHLLRTVPAPLATSTAFVNPLVALGFGAALGGENIGRTELVAAALIVSGVAVVATARARPRAASLDATCRASGLARR